MKTYFECFPCYIQQALRAARLFTDDPKVIKSVIDAVGSLFPEISLDKTSAEIGEFIYGKIREVSGVEDPYEDMKNKNTDEALQLVPFCQNIIADSADPLFIAIKMAIAGNVIDFAINHTVDIPAEIEAILHKELTINDYDLLKKRLDTSETILYIGDNAGESVFDRLLIEQLAGKKVYFGVRGRPVINDVVEKDAKRAGIDKVAELVSSGSAVPGTIISKCSEEFNELFRNADIVISKGQGNYEGLSDEEREIFFLLRVKCEVIAGHIGVPVGSLVLMRSGN
ncbi:MAG: ARMT1-like domain-containing protein [Candidatus Celaenobacter antarcticus]|nr:ARMT1-like domain-containing protein [Candidatus Celaenobacter antarcticus]